MARPSATALAGETLTLAHTPSREAVAVTRPPSSGTQALLRGWSDAALAAEVARAIPPRSVVNLGIGLPTQVAQYLDPAASIMIHSENGLLGVEGRPTEATLSPTRINAGKESVDVRPGAAYFDSALSFAMIRGGHVNLAILGGMQVDVQGSLANWSVPGRKLTGMGGAMDLVTGARAVWVMMRHADRSGASKLLERCTLPLTGAGVVARIITELGWFRPTGTHFEVISLAPGVTLSDVGDPALFRTDRVFENASRATQRADEP